MLSLKEENILLAAEKLFAEKGFDATSTREISAAASVNISMISYYFGSKEQLLEKLFEYRMKESSDFTKDVLDLDKNEWEKLMMVIDLYFQRVMRLQDFYRVMQVEGLTNENPQIRNFLRTSKLGFLSVYRELRDRGVEKGIFTKKPRVEFLHTMIVGMVFQAFNGVELYREFSNSTYENFQENFFKELQNHLKEMLKYSLGYEQ